MKKANDAAMARARTFAAAAGRRAGPSGRLPAQTLRRSPARPLRRLRPPGPPRRPACLRRTGGQQQAPATRAPPLHRTGPAPPAPPAAPVGPLPAGTPAGWLPDPSGAPDTLRYWTATPWTQHVAQRG